MTDHYLPDRRAAVKALALSPLAAAPVAASPHADATLLHAYAAFLAAWEAERAVYRSIDPDAAGEAEDKRLFAMVERTLEAGAAVSAIPAQTMQGLRCKAHVALYHHGDMAALVKAEESGALASIACDLLAMA